ncbi:MAG TPA: mechanosensitive ion channel family protein [Longimicrobiales bacterium]|nr:mechanosensitive ion channel family protein [Longimicrobiales bacterium]
MRRILLSLALVHPLVVVLPLSAQTEAPGQDTTVVATQADSPVAQVVAPDRAPVVVRGDTVAYLYGRLGPFSPAERAAAVAERIGDLRFQGASPDSVQVVDDGVRAEVWVSSAIVLSVTPEDTVASGLGRAATAARLADGVRAALSASVFTRSLRDLLLGTLWTFLATAALYGLFRLLKAWYPRLYHRIRSVQQDKLPSIRFQGLVLLTGDRIGAVVLFLARASRLVVTALLLFLYFPLVFSFFPATRVLAQRILALALEPTRAAWWAVVGYLPNLFYIAVISVVMHYGLKVIQMIFGAVGREVIRLPGFYPDWAGPTFKLIRVLGFAFAVILIWPYLPNSDSVAFKGVAGFLGLLLTFGSAGAVSNVVGGVVMIYMRPFQIGDRVKIADTIGDVVERGMLVTRLRTPKNVEVTIPNSMVLGSYIVNYSATARDGGVILHTVVTLGYDIPWPKVHEAMKDAALRTAGIMEDPAPFVLQTALGDYSVSYELNAYTDQPQIIPRIYSGLHQNLQDALAEAGIEILSPIYHAVRDGNLSTIPAPHTPPAAEAPAFRHRPVGGSA